MSCVDAEETPPDSKLGKIAINKDADKKNGKPCIDFQPGDRWQIKDEKNTENMLNSKNKEVVCSNGRRSLRLRSSSAKSQDSCVTNGEAGESGSDSENVNLNNKSAPEKPKVGKNEKVTSKRKLSDAVSDTEKTVEVPADKKSKVDAAEDDSVKEEVEDESEDALTAAKENSSDAVKENASAVETEECDSAESSVDNMDVDHCEESKIVSEPSSPQPSEEIKSVKVEDDNKEAEIIELSPEKNENSNKKDSKLTNDDHPDKSDCYANDNDIEIINIQDDTKKSDDCESDSECQILDDAVDSVTDTTSFETAILSDTDVSLTAGFPYYNSLKEKISNFKAGDYKPVKFPHTGTLLLADNEVIIESPSLLVPLLIKEADKIPKLEGSVEKKPEEKPPSMRLNMMGRKNFFQSSVGQFLINLGTSRVQEWYHRDMKRAKLKQLKSKKNVEEDLEKTVEFHEKRHKELMTINAVFNFRTLQCKFCSFKSESRCVMEGHSLIPHISTRREYRCNYCDFLSRNPEEIVFHFEAMHGKKAIIEPDISFLHECIFCSFQTNLKAKVNVHMNRCRKHFIPSQNLAPPFDFEFPGVTTKPVTITDVIGHRRLLLSSAKNRLPISGDSPHSALDRKKLASVLNKLSSPIPFSDPKSASIMSQLMKNPNQISGSNLQLPPGIVITRPRAGPVPQMRPVSRFPQPRNIQPLQLAPRQGPPYTTTLTSTAANLASSGISITPITRPNILPRTNAVQGIRNVTLTPIGTAANRPMTQKSGAPQPVALFTSGLLGQPQARLPTNVNLRPLRPITPYQRLNTPPSQVVKGSSGNTFVVCEICDSYIKDLEELRTHMNWVHKVKIHPKMLVSRPPLNCQKCQWRFFTDQGLERHLLGAHGLVTTNMQEMANKNQDGGRCIICGAVFTYKLVSHMTQVHKVTLKPAHLSYKCTVCTATFTLYRLFESHVYNVHSGSAKRPAEDPPLEPLPKKSAEEVGPKRCKGCNVIAEDMEKHLKKSHIKKCSVKLCRIEKCKKCLYSSDEMIVFRMSDLGLDSEEDDTGEESSADEDDAEGSDVESG